MVQPLPKMNPLASIQAFTQPRRNQLAGLASGLLSGTDWGSGMSVGFARAAEGRQADDAYAETQKAEAMRQEQLQKTIGYLRQQPGGALFADAAERGDMDGKEAFKSWVDQSRGGAAKPMEINGQLVDPTTGKVIGDYRTPETGKAGDAYTLGPGQVRYGPNGEVIAKGPEKRSGSMSPTTQKELFETDEGIQAANSVIGALDQALTLNDTAWEGPLADAGSAGASLFGNQDAIATQDLKNLVTSQALDQLKSVFGGMPTEGERKILLDIQGSVGQSRENRAKIFDRAKKAAIKRLKFNEDKARGIRSGEYFDEGYGTAPAGGADDIEAILNGLGI